YYEIPEQPWLQVVPGPAAEVHVLAPTLVDPGSPFPLRLRAVDAFGNPTETSVPEVSLHGGPGVSLSQETVAASRFERGVAVLESGAVIGARTVSPAVGGNGEAWRIESRSELGASLSNPIRLRAAGETQLLWGDLHGQTGETGGTGS